MIRVMQFPPGFDRNWRSKGLCTQVGWHAFFAEPGENERTFTARQICQSSCPVQQICLDVALSDPSTIGVWGGTTRTERKRIRATPGFEPKYPFRYDTLLTDSRTRSVEELEAEDDAESVSA